MSENDKLIYASYQGDLEALKKILNHNEKEIDIHHKDSYGNNMLMLACMGGHIEIVKYLFSTRLTKHIEMYDTNDYEMNALKLTCDAALLQSRQTTHVEIIKYLVMEQNFKLSEDLTQWLSENDHIETLAMMQSRDLYQKLDTKLHDGNQVRAKKI